MWWGHSSTSLNMFGGGSLYCEVQCIMNNDHMVPPLTRQTDAQDWKHYLPGTSLAGSNRTPRLSDIHQCYLVCYILNKLLCYAPHLSTVIKCDVLSVNLWRHYSNRPRARLHWTYRRRRGSRTLSRTLKTTPRNQYIFFFLKFCLGYLFFLLGHWYRCFGRLVTSALNFKVRVHPSLACMLHHLHTMGLLLVWYLLTSRCPVW